MHSRFKYGPVCFISASAKEISKSIILKSALFYGRLNRSSQPGELLSCLPATSSIIMCPQPGGQLPLPASCTPQSTLGKLCVQWERLPIGCQVSVCLTFGSQSCPTSALSFNTETRKRVFVFPAAAVLSQCAAVLEKKGDGNPIRPSLHEQSYSQQD